MQRITVFWCVLVAGMIGLPLSASAWSDVGMVDYFRVSKIRGMPVRDNIESILNSDLRPKKELKHLIGKSAPSEQSPIAVGDCFSVNLAAGFIGDFREVGQKGEVVIVARVSERKVGSLEFGSGSVKSGRVIYFGNDVKQRQQLNFSYLPMYGPMKYTGRPLDVQLYVIEIDDADQFKPLLSTLANVGAGAYPPAAPALKLLDTIGGALLSASRDDNLLEYSFCLNGRMPGLDKTYGFNYGEYPVFEAGHYVVVRQQNRKGDLREMVSNVYYDPYDQVLKRYDPQSKSIKPYVDDSYLIVHVKRELISSALDSDDKFYKTFETLRDEERQSTSDYVERTRKDLIALADDLERENALKKLNSLYEKVISSTTERAAIAKLDASELLVGIQGQIADREACTDSASCPKVPTKRELMELLAMMRATSIFADSVDKLTYEVMKTQDVARDAAILDAVETRVKAITK